MSSGISLANKCQLLFGFAVVVIIAGALSVPWVRTYSIVQNSQIEVARQLSEAWLKNTIQHEPPAPAPPTSPSDDLPEHVNGLLAPRIRLLKVSDIDSDDKTKSF